MIQFKNFTIAKALQKLPSDTQPFIKYNERTGKWMVSYNMHSVDIETHKLPIAEATQTITIAVFDVEFQAQQYLDRLNEYAMELKTSNMTVEEFMGQFDYNGEEIIQMNVHLTADGVKKLSDTRKYGYLLHDHQRSALCSGDNLVTINRHQLAYLQKICQRNKVDIATNPY